MRRDNYVGFTWDLRARTVEIMVKKKAKYLAALTSWVPGTKVLQRKA